MANNMKVARLYGFDDIRIEQMPMPVPGPEDALIKTRASGICSGDVMPWYIEKKAPLVIGHEPSGEVVETGKNVASISIGDRLFVHHHAPCFKCRHCLRGDYVQCQTWRESGIIPGGISEFILVPGHILENDTLILPDGISFEDGALTEPLACVLKGLKRAHPRQGDTALVLGLGAMGIMHILALRKLGAGMIIGTDFVKYRQKKALELGADHVVDAADNVIEAVSELTDGRMADIVVVGPNSADALNTGIQCAGRGATVLMFTPVKPDEKLSISPNDLYFKDISIITSYSCGPSDTADAMEFIKEGAVRASHIVTHRFPIDDTAKAYALTAEAGESIKSMVVF